MTENPNDPLSNGLGGRKYEPWEEQTIHRLALFIRSRDCSLNFYGTPRPRPKDYMLLYVKAAGVAFETAKALYGFKLPKHMEEKSVEEWLNILTGLPIAPCDESTYTRFDGIEGDGPNVNGDSFPVERSDPHSGMTQLGRCDPITGEFYAAVVAAPGESSLPAVSTPVMETLFALTAKLDAERAHVGDPAVTDSPKTKPEDPC